MPFKKLGGGRYEGPSGKVFNYNQVRMYYSRGGSFPGQKKSSNPYPSDSDGMRRTFPKNNLKGKGARYG